MTRVIFPFDEIALWQAPNAATGAEQMALDETMLRLADRPILRLYRWPRREVTFGYPQRWEEACVFAGTRPIVRRCTGGGFVEHGDDVTLALAVPAGNSFARLAPAESYRRIHEALCAALDSDGLRLADQTDCMAGAACFTSPAPFDVLLGSRKVAGGAQRRSRDGFLYQGSVQAASIPPNFDTRLGKTLARKISDWNPPGEWRDLSAELVTHSYGSEDWNRRR